MISFSMRGLVRLAIVVGVIGGWTWETYVSSGWNTDVDLAGIVQETKREKNNAEGGIRGFLVSEANRQNTTDGVCTSYKEGIADSVGIWFAPYRRFPETPGEGSGRNMGDYEYFDYIPKKACSQVRLNYGAFKGSRADKNSSRIAKKGLDKEFMHAQKKGFDLFIVDIDKTWVSEGLVSLCLADKACTLISDGFVAIRIKETLESREYIRELSRYGRFRWQEEVARDILVREAVIKGIDGASLAGWRDKGNNQELGEIYFEREVKSGRSEFSLPALYSRNIPYNILLRLEVYGKGIVNSASLQCGRRNTRLSLENSENAEGSELRGFEKEWRSCERESGAPRMVLETSRGTIARIVFALENRFDRLAGKK